MQGNRVLTCELRDDDRAGAGFDVQLLEDGELLVSRRCATATVARDVVQILKTDHLRAGWIELMAEDNAEGEHL